MPEYIPSPRQWVRDQVELYERRHESDDQSGAAARLITRSPPDRSILLGQRGGTQPWHG
jgi:hypothetical protein